MFVKYALLIGNLCLTICTYNILNLPFFIWTWVIFVRCEIHMKPFYSPNRYWFLVWNKCSYNSQIAQYASFVWVLISLFKATSRYPLCFTYFGSGFCLFKYSHVVYNITKREILSSLSKRCIVGTRKNTKKNSI